MHPIKHTVAKVVSVDPAALQSTMVPYGHWAHHTGTMQQDKPQSSACISFSVS